MRFADPIVLALLPLVAGYVWLDWPRTRRKSQTYIAFPPFRFLEDDALVGWRARMIVLLPALRSVVVALLIVALARPQGANVVQDIRVRGRNIIIALDISSSMKAVDFRPGNRLEVAKRVLAEFVQARRGDFLGLVVFASRAFTQVPLTSDRLALTEMLGRADIGLLPDGTAIGTALAMSENHLKNLPQKSSAIVLITDGGNNTGSPNPISAAEIARALGIRVYTIGVSARDSTAAAIRQSAQATPGRVYAEVPTTLSARDEAMLDSVASISGGQYFRATDPGGLAGIMTEIDRLEKTELHLREVRSYREYFPFLLLPALLLVALELALRVTWLRTLP